jgi:excisionase family DNA binding protein
MATTAAKQSLPKMVDLRTIERDLGIPYSTLRQWIAEGHLRAFKVGPKGKAVRVLVSDLDALIMPVA